MERAKYAANALASTSGNMIFGRSETDYWEGAVKCHKHTFLGDDKILVAIQEKSKEDDKLKNVSDGEQLVKICRQLNFFYKEENWKKKRDHIALRCPLWMRVYEIVISCTKQPVLLMRDFPNKRSRRLDLEKLD